MHRAAEGGIGGRAWRGAPLSTYNSATAELVRRELASVLESPEFMVPERARRFLSYIVEESLAGRADRIKAFSIATDVLGRGSSFDGSSRSCGEDRGGARAPRARALLSDRRRRRSDHHHDPQGGLCADFTLRDTGSGCGEEESGKPSVVSKQPRRWRRLGWPLIAGGHTRRRGADRRLELRAASGRGSEHDRTDADAFKAARLSVHLRWRCGALSGHRPGLDPGSGAPAGVLPRNRGGGRAAADVIRHGRSGSVPASGRAAGDRQALSVECTTNRHRRRLGGLGGELRRGSRPCQAPGQ